MENSPPKKKKKTKISTVWNYFTRAKENKTMAICTFCKNSFKSSGNTSNLWNHLERCHVYLAVKKKDSHTGSTSSEKSSLTSSSQSSSQRSLPSYFTVGNLYDSHSQRKKQIDEAVVQMICKDLQPFNIVNDEGFVHLLHVLDPRYRLPCKTTLKNVMVANKYNAVKLELQNQLNSVEYVAITTDLWTSRAMESYLTSTCHFIDNEFSLISKVLATKPLLESQNHTAENIAASLSEVFEEWKIKDKIVCIVTDNAMSMLKACEILKKRHMPCIAHTINLIVQENLNLAAYKILKKCKDVVRFFKSSTIATAKLLEEQNTNKPLKLIQEVPTRWNSCYLMISRIIEIKDAVNMALLKSSKNAPKPFDQTEIDVLNQLKLILKVFDDLTAQFSSSDKVTSSIIVPLICGLDLQLQKFKDEIQTNEVKMFLENIIKSVEKRLFCYEERTVARLCAILDPRFKKEAFRIEANAKHASNSLESEMIFATATNRHNGENDSTDFDNSTSKHDLRTPLFGFLKTRIQNKVNRTPTVDAILKKKQYFEQPNCAEDACPLLYWKVNNNLQMEPLPVIAKKYLCVPASSIESERIFSKAGLIINDRRTRLKPNIVDQLIFIKTNDMKKKTS